MKGMPTYFKVEQNRDLFFKKNQESAPPTFPTSPNLLLSPVTPVKVRSIFFPIAFFMICAPLHTSCTCSHMHVRACTVVDSI